MSVAYGNILRMNDIKETWYKWDYVCLNCDSLIEMTIKVTGKPHLELCPVCLVDPVNMSLMSVVDATIRTSTEKENPNMDTLDTLSTPYNPNLLVTYKKIAGTYSAPEAPEYITEKVVDLEWNLEHLRQSRTTLNKLEDKLIQVQDIILAQYQDSQDQEVLESIANILDIELTKEITWSATIEVSGTVQVSLTDNYDLELMLADELNVSAYGGDIEVGDYEVTNVREDY
jgi:hypothetical protein